MQEIIHTAKVVKSGSTLIVPQHLTYKQAISILERQEQAEEELVALNEIVPVFPWEGALALRRAMEQMFGFSLTQPIETMFGPILPKEITIQTGVKTSTKVLWGRMAWPLAKPKTGWDGKAKVDEFLDSGIGHKGGLVVFQVGGQIRRKWLGEFKKLMELTQKLAREESIYRSKAVRIQFTDDHGEPIPLPEPEFMDLSSAILEDMVYTKELTELIETYIMTPLRHREVCAKAGIPFKRGVLAAGVYGTGKTLLAQAVGRVGNENGVTFLYIKNAKELPEAIRFAKQYSPAVVFAEDLDRATQGTDEQEDRTEEVDEILNTLDGIDSKGAEIMVVLTTNHLGSVNPAMLRPGRLDVVIEITPPDAEAVERLVRIYGRGLIAENTDLTEVGKLLSGFTPAVIREAVERSKLAAISRTGADSIVVSQDLVLSAHSMVQQQKLLTPKAKSDVHPADQFIGAVANAVKKVVTEDVNGETRYLIGKLQDGEHV